MQLQLTEKVLFTLSFRTWRTGGSTVHFAKRKLCFDLIIITLVSLRYYYRRENRTWFGYHPACHSLTVTCILERGFHRCAATEYLNCEILHETLWMIPYAIALEAPKKCQSSNRISAYTYIHARQTGAASVAPSWFPLTWFALNNTRYLRRHMWHTP